MVLTKVLSIFVYILSLIKHVGLYKIATLSRTIVKILFHWNDVLFYQVIKSFIVLFQHHV